MVTETATFRIGGMACSFCATTIEKALKRMGGVRDVRVNLSHQEAWVEYDPDRVGKEDLKGFIEGLGYVVLEGGDLYREDRLILERARKKMLVAWSIALPVLAIMSMRDLFGFPLEIPYFKEVLWGLATFVLFGLGASILKSSLLALSKGVLNEHVLFSLGAAGAYLTGMLSYTYPVPSFFGASIFLTAFHLLSGYLSAKVRVEASESVRRLLSLQPLKARVLRDGREVMVPVEEVGKGEIVSVRPGEKIPVDGVVVEGASSVSQAIVTGESMPVDVEEGDEVVAGSLNHQGLLRIRVTRVGEETFIRRVARFVEEAREKRPRIQLLFDRVIAYYVPGVMVLSAGSLLFWLFLGEPIRAVYAALAVLIIGYPCAMGMASPLALMMGSGMGAERGILIRSGEAYEGLNRVRLIVFDKTGTLTRGEPVVTDVVAGGGIGEEDLLLYAASAERASEHPLGRAVVRSAEERGIHLRDPSSFRAFSGLGVEALVEGREVLVGSKRFVEGRGVDLSPLLEEVGRLEGEGKTVILACIDGRPAGLLAISDRVKEGAPSVIEGIKGMGLTPVMLTGDNKKTARAIAERVGIGEVVAEVLPQDKALWIRRLQERGEMVAMVGDGVNDAPALSQADVGIAIGAGTDIAKESAHVILLEDRLEAVLTALSLGKTTYRKIRENIFFAFIYNLLGFPIAASGMLHPLMAMGAMVASTLSIILNSFLIPRIVGRAVSSRYRHSQNNSR